VLGLETVAEGIETEEQMDAVRELGADLAQGFLISRPLPADRLAPFLATAGP
jgi:EAL domain-containing protein (putative c-di-GMP-specific phosphodiesterase class I)